MVSFDCLPVDEPVTLRVTKTFESKVLSNLTNPSSVAIATSVSSSLIEKRVVANGKFSFQDGGSTSLTIAWEEDSPVSTDRFSTTDDEALMAVGTNDRLVKSIIGLIFVID
jgi:hypothetical protein